MADLSYFVKPYEVSQAITLLGGQQTLSNLLSAVNANIANELPFQCPKCVGTGRINSQANECDYCGGYGRVELEPTVLRSFEPSVQVLPNEPTII